MNATHIKVLRLLKLVVTDEADGLKQRLAESQDEDVVRDMYLNYRRDGATPSLRLSLNGFKIMGSYFAYYEISFPPKSRLKAAHFIYLDRAATMPYYLTGKRSVIVFDYRLGWRLMMAQGDLDVLIEEDGVYFGVGNA